MEYGGTHKSSHTWGREGHSSIDTWTKRGHKTWHTKLCPVKLHTHTHTRKRAKINKYMYVQVFTEKSVDESHGVKDVHENQQEREPRKEKEKKNKETGLFQACNSKHSISYNNKTNCPSLSPKKRTKIGEMLRK